MSTVFIGGSRRVSRLPAQVKERLNNIIGNGFRIIVGDANGVDKAVQKYLLEVSYENVIVYCSGNKCRNNVGKWKECFVKTANNSKGFSFYAEKDREMADRADFGLMIWDGKSPGTILNVLRLVRAGKKAVLFNIPDRRSTTFKTSADWDGFISRCSPDLRNDLRERARPEEWTTSEPPQQTSFLNAPEAAISAPRSPAPLAKTDEELTAGINVALATGDSGFVIDALGSIARARGMSQVAKDTGLARESLYRSLSAGGNPEFATVLKVISSVGLRLTVSKVS